MIKDKEKWTQKEWNESHNRYTKDIFNRKNNLINFIEKNYTEYNEKEFIFNMCAITVNNLLDYYNKEDNIYINDTQLELFKNELKELSNLSNYILTNDYYKVATLFRNTHFKDNTGWDDEKNNYKWTQLNLKAIEKRNKDIVKFFKLLGIHCSL